VRERVYIETTIPSFYYNSRETDEMRMMAEFTRRWWSTQGADYDLFTSDVVVSELEHGIHPLKNEKLALLSGLPLLQITRDVVELAEEYIRALAMPRRPGADALHLALASVHQCDILLTWNCEHLANPNKISQLGSITRRNGLSLPQILTPELLLQRGK
jgi:predicted nucleic acid-binding protein